MALLTVLSMSLSTCCHVWRQSVERASGQVSSEFMYQCYLGQTHTELS